MHHTLLLLLCLFLFIFLIVMFAEKIKVAYPIFLVLAGLGIGFIPGMPKTGVTPDVIFLIFLPPLLYEAAWYTSWHDFWKCRRPIALLAFGLVFFTSVVVAFTSVALIPGFTLALGFLLGGIVSPPDAVAATSILKHISVPKRIVTILEGESLVNDASSLIVFRFALAAILTGSFSLQQATGQFFLVTGMGIVVGLVVAHIIYAIHRFLPTTPGIDAALTVMTPYFMYLTAEHFHYSGVMAVVSGGLFISYRSHEIFSTGATRLNMLGVWHTLIFVLNGFVFILIGLELPTIVDALGARQLTQAIIYGLIISGIAIVLRFIWIYPATFLPRFIFPSIRRKEANPGWKGPLIVGWAGMRGVVSLATALSIPRLLDDGTPFPHRNLILFITFVVILVTLVLQGFTLPAIVKWLKLPAAGGVPSDQQETAIKLALEKVALERLDAKHASLQLSNEMVGFFKKDLQHHIDVGAQRLDSLECNENEKLTTVEYHAVLRDIYSEQRKALFRLRQQKKFDDEEIRKMEVQLDLDDLKVSGIKH